MSDVIINLETQSFVIQVTQATAELYHESIK